MTQEDTMPEGIITEVDGGFATIDFIDRSLRGPGLQRLLDVGGPETIEPITRSGPRKKYRVPEGNAREAGLLDGEGLTGVVGDTGAADRLAGAGGGLSVSPPVTTSKNSWATGRSPFADAPKPVADDDDDDLDIPVEGDDEDGEGDEAPLVGGEPVVPVAAEDAGVPAEALDAEPRPDENWKLDDLRAYARGAGIDLDGARSKADVLSRIRNQEVEK